MDAFQDLNNLYFFARVVDCGSYTAAAEALNMQTSKRSSGGTALCFTPRAGVSDQGHYPDHGKGLLHIRI